MKAVVLREAGGPDKLKLEDYPEPRPGPDEVLVRLRAAALNHRDVWIRLGKYAGIKLPAILGSDGAGEVTEAGAGVTPNLVGRKVVINPGWDWGPDDRSHGPNFRILGMPDDGTYAQFVKVPAQYVLDMPAGWSWEEAAALPLAGLTAYRAVVTRANVKSGETVLVTGIGGGVAVFALQIAKALGAAVVVTSGSDEKIKRAKELGATGGANYKSDWVKAIAGMTNGGPDVVIDSAGGEALAKAIEVVKPGGRIVNFGATLGPVPQFEVRRLFWKQLNVLGTTMGNPAEFAAMVKLYAEAGLKPAVDQVFPLADAAGAHRRMDQAAQFGKIVLGID